MQDVVVIEHIAELCATSGAAAELARRLVHSPMVGNGDAVGAVFYIVTQAGDLDLIGSYGKVPNLGDDLTIWAANPLAKAVADLKPHAELMPNHDGEEYLVASIPLLRGSDPIGVAAVVRRKNGVALASKLKPEAVRAIGNTYAIWLDSLGLKPNTGPISLATQTDLTQRQLEILKEMAHGKTNAQIASQLILSESSIRQETVRIYRALGVGTRSEAARKALNLGLIDRILI